MLLDDIHHLTLVSNFLEFLSRVVTAIVGSSRLEVDNLLSSFDVLLKYAGLSFEFLILRALLLDIALHLLKLTSDIVDSLLGVIIKGLNLVFETLLNIFVLFDVLLHYDFLSLLGNSVELDIHSTLLVIDNFEVLDLAFSLMELKLGLSIKNISHLLDLFSSSLLNFPVFFLNNVLSDENGILVISGNGKLGYFNLTLFKVDNHFKVELKLLGTVLNLLAFTINDVKLILKGIQVSTEVVEMILKLVKSLVVYIASPL